MKITDTVLVGIIAATTSICSAIVTTYAQYAKELLFKKKDITRKDLNTLYTLSNEIQLNKKILESNLRYIETLEIEDANFYVTGYIPQNNIWETVKKENILCVIDDKILTKKLFDFYAFIDQSMITLKHENEEIGKGTIKKDTFIEVLENIDDILKRINIKINELYKNLKK